MSTLNDLIASIHTSLHSFSGQQEQVTWLTSGCTSSDTTLAVASSDTVLRGLCEIEDELIYVHTSDSGGLQLAPFGRGFRGSTAAAHAANVAVTFDPVFPRAEIRRAIDQCIESLFPTLYQIKTYDFQTTAAGLGYDLPADCDGVLDVKFEAPDPMNYYERFSRWTFDSASALATGKVLNLYDNVGPDVTVRVVYRAKFTAFAGGTSTLASAGLSESWADLILFNVSSRMVRFLDPARLQIQTVENISRSQVVQAGDAGKVANQLYSMYQQRLGEERTRLLELTPPSIHFTR
jgi:hypothetical protein